MKRKSRSLFQIIKNLVLFIQAMRHINSLHRQCIKGLLHGQILAAGRTKPIPHFRTTKRSPIACMAIFPKQHPIPSAPY